MHRFQCIVNQLFSYNRDHRKKVDNNNCIPSIDIKKYITIFVSLPSIYHWCIVAPPLHSILIIWPPCNNQLSVSYVPSVQPPTPSVDILDIKFRVNFIIRRNKLQILIVTAERELFLLRNSLSSLKIIVCNRPVKW